MAAPDIRTPAPGTGEGRDVVPPQRVTDSPTWSASTDRVLPSSLANAVTALAEQLEVSVAAVLLAAHARVLRALTNSLRPVTGVWPSVPDGTGPYTCHLDASDGSWVDLVRRMDVEISRLGRGRTAHVQARRDTSVVLEVQVAAPAGGAVLGVRFRRTGADLEIRVRTAADQSDAERGTRTAGYHLTALTHLTADPHAPHQMRGLVSEGERAVQLQSLAGPARTLPDQRFHELFEAQVRFRPEAIAARLGPRTLTYGALNDRANQIAHALIAGGLSREDVVAVATERTLDWMASVIAIFKAGGAYLPIEPHFPAERMAHMLRQSTCRTVLATSTEGTELRAALAAVPDCRLVELDDPGLGRRPIDDPNLEVTADQLAYIFFTSGSTGRPKGAMCEQAGMLNHLFAKIDDLDIRSGGTVAQTAPQCFDISLWQLLSALLVGGDTLIIDQQTLVDVPRFVDTIIAEDVKTLQVVPSYLEVLLSYLETRPRPLDQLTHVSVTGEALKWGLTSRWFALYPHIRLVNAYGLTETSDDTNHEVMTGVPESRRVPLGRAVNNVHVYVVDEYLNLVPMGAPGEIVFSGICVGRGYVNDEERTRLAFATDPHREGERLYRSGDYGRWLPDGRLDFLGRRDAQVKVRGFRIEIGEIENTLLAAPGIRDAAVVVLGTDDGEDATLTGFYTSNTHLGSDELRGFLSGRLPEYMIPAVLHRLEELPINDNGKIDRKRLVTLAADRSRASTGTAWTPTPTERRLAAAWAQVLRVPVEDVGRDDNFFERGGSSLSAIKMIIDLGRSFSLEELAGNPVLGDLASLIDRR